MYIVQIENDYYIRFTSQVTKDGVLKPSKDSLVMTQETASKMSLHFAQCLANKYKSLNVKIMKG